MHAGFVDDVALVYGAADVIAVPTKQPDPLPNAALEAAAAGCCVVASDHGGLPEILRDGETGLLVTPNDPARPGRRDRRRRPRAPGRCGRRRRRRSASRPARMLEEIQALYDTVAT